MAVGTLTFTLSAPARILPHETASSGRAPESDPSYCRERSVSFPLNQIQNVYLLTCIDVNCIVCTISLCFVNSIRRHRTRDTDEEHCIRNLVLTYPTAQYDHPRLLRMNAHIVQTSNIRDDIDIKLSFGFIGVEVDHIAKRAIRQGRAEDRDVVLLAFSRESILRQRETL